MKDKNAWIWLPVIAFIVSFAATYPGVSVLIDETQYLRQAAAFANGQILVENLNPISNESFFILPSTYPPGTSIIASLFIFFGDWTTAFWMPALALTLTILFTFILLKSCNLNPYFSLLILFFPPALVMARVVSSDVISAAIVALGWLLFWKGVHSRKFILRFWFAAGFIAGISLLFRETNVLFFAPLFAGAMLRNNKGWIWLLIGGLAGTLLRPLLSFLIFNDPLFIRDPGYGFSIGSIFDNALIYIPMLTVIIPGGLVFALLYRGERRIEVLSTIFLVLIFFLSYDFRGEESGLLKSLVLGPRFYIPLLPVLAFAAAESVPRIMNRYYIYQKAKPFLAPSLIILITIGVVISNAALYQWTKIQEEIQNTIIQYVPEHSPVIYNQRSTRKYMSELQGYPANIHFEQLSNSQMDQIGGFYIVFLQRTDSDFWKDYAQQENSFVENLPVNSIADKKYTDTYRLKIYTVESLNSK